MTENQKLSERLNYTIENGIFVGNTVNMPLVAQATSLDELQVKLKAMAKMYIQLLSDTFEQEEPFEIKEMSRPEWDAQK